MFRKVAIAVVMGLTACTGGPTAEQCDARGSGEDVGWCHYERATTALKAGRPEDALQIAAGIQDPGVRAAALDHLFSQGIAGVDQARAHQLCSSLPEPHRTGCMRTWDRPHLWDLP